MKRETEQTRNYPGQPFSVHYLQTGNSVLYKPCSDRNGIHCVGDRFGYIVEWQITDKGTGNKPAAKVSV